MTDDGKQGTGLTPGADSPAPVPPQVPAVQTPEPAPEPAKDTKEQKLEAALFGAAKTFGERAQAYQMLSVYRQQKAIVETAAALGSLSWGSKLSPAARAFVARYALETGTDATRHWYVLGGRMYDCAELYYDLCAANPKFVRANGGPGFEHLQARLIHDDERLSAAERAERKAARAAHGAPEDSPGIAVVFLYYKDSGPHIGCNWVKVGTTKDGRQRDPVGMEHPTQTAITRAFRKAAKKAEPVWFLHHPALRAAEEVITQGREIHEEEPVPVALPDRSESPEPMEPRS